MSTYTDRDIAQAADAVVLAMAGGISRIQATLCAKAVLQSIGFRYVPMGERADADV